MWMEIYKYAFITIHILGIIVCLYRIGKGKHMREETPLGNAIGMLFGILWMTGFIIFFW
jgi:hypothetical protein